MAVKRTNSRLQGAARGRLALRTVFFFFLLSPIARAMNIPIIRIKTSEEKEKRLKL